MADPLEVSASLPAPPAYYTRYTSENLRLLDVLNKQGREVLVDEPVVPTEFDLKELEPPRADWIVEEGGYASFGGIFPIPTRTMTLPEAGLKQLYDPDAKDRRPALRSLLRTLLLTYHSLLAALLRAPPLDPLPNTNAIYNYTEWIRLAAMNMMHSINGMRAMQARQNMEAMLRTQVQRRRERVKELNAKCDTLTETLAKLRAKAAKLSAAHQAVPPVSFGADSSSGQQKQQQDDVPVEDVAKWVDEVTT